MSKPKRLAEPGKRHRRDNGPQVMEVTEAPPVPLQNQGTLHVATYDIIQSGPQGLLERDKKAQVLAQQHGLAFGEELKTQWTWETPWIVRQKNAMRIVRSVTPGDCLGGAVFGANEPPRDSDGNILAIGAGQKLLHDHRARTSANYAMQWRPTFLAVVALAHGITIGCNAAGISNKTVIQHRDADPDFDAQVLAAQTHCIDLLHSVTMRDALEGTLEPVYWQGIRVGDVRKFDNRLRVELLRAHMPTTFKTPGSRVNVNTGNQLIFGDGQAVNAEAVKQLMEMRQISLAKIQEKKAQAREISGTDRPHLMPPTP